MDRTGYIGGSDVGAILGVDRFRTALDVYREKVGEVLPFEGNADTQRGTRLEPEAARLYTERTGIRLQRMNTGLAHPEHPWAHGHVDRVTVGLDRREIREIKCPRLGAFSKIKREGIDESRIAQLQWYLGLANTKMIVPAAEWIVFCADLWDYLPVRVEFDPALFADMIAKAGHFWHEHVQKKVPPTQEQADQFKVDIEAAGGVAVRRDDVEFVNAMEMLREAKSLSNEAEEIETQAKSRLAELIEMKHGVYLAPGGRLTYFQVSGRSSFDKKALANVGALDPMLVQECLLKSANLAPHAVMDLVKEIKDCRLNLASFEKTGAPYSVMKPTFFAAD